MGTTNLESRSHPPFAVEWNGRVRQIGGDGGPAFTFVVRDEADWRRLLSETVYSAALRFIGGDFDVRGDLVSAIQFKYARSRHGLREAALRLAASLAPRRIETWFQSRARAARNIRFHYDRSNEFYRQFLDANMQYSSACFEDPSWTLERAQAAKLDLICRKLDLRRGERFLDVGCGWGGLALHAAEKYGVEAVGCTLSRCQSAYARDWAARRGLAGRATFHEVDYRDLDRTWQKIASIGMFEHVGRHRLGQYFRKLCSLLEEDGLLLNSGIVRPQPVRDGPETLFLDRKVFPCGELAHLSDVIREAENARLEILHVQDLRLHYARTCREWVHRLERNMEACLGLVDAETYRTWRLYLAASAVGFEQGTTGVYQVLMGKRSGNSASRPCRDWIPGAS